MAGRTGVSGKKRGNYLIPMRSPPSPSSSTTSRKRSMTSARSSSSSSVRSGSSNRSVGTWFVPLKITFDGLGGGRKGDGLERSMSMDSSSRQRRKSRGEPRTSSSLSPKPFRRSMQDKRKKSNSDRSLLSLLSNSSGGKEKTKSNTTNDDDDDDDDDGDDDDDDDDDDDELLTNYNNDNMDTTSIATGESAAQEEEEEEEAMTKQEGHDVISSNTTTGNNDPGNIVCVPNEQTTNVFLDQGSQLFLDDIPEADSENNSHVTSSTAEDDNMFFPSSSVASRAVTSISSSSSLNSGREFQIDFAETGRTNSDGMLNQRSSSMSDFSTKRKPQQQQQQHGLRARDLLALRDQLIKPQDDDDFSSEDEEDEEHHTDEYSGMNSAKDVAAAVAAAAYKAASFSASKVDGPAEEMVAAIAAMHNDDVEYAPIKGPSFDHYNFPKEVLSEEIKQDTANGNGGMKSVVHGDTEDYSRMNSAEEVAAAVAAAAMKAASSPPHEEIKQDVYTTNNGGMTSDTLHHGTDDYSRMNSAEEVAVAVAAAAMKAASSPPHEEIEHDVYTRSASTNNEYGGMKSTKDTAAIRGTPSADEYSKMNSAEEVAAAVAAAAMKAASSRQPDAYTPMDVSSVPDDEINYDIYSMDADDYNNIQSVEGTAVGIKPVKSSASSTSSGEILDVYSDSGDTAPKEMDEYSKMNSAEDVAAAVAAAAAKAAVASSSKVSMDCWNDDQDDDNINYGAGGDWGNDNSTVVTNSSASSYPYAAKLRNPQPTSARANAESVLSMAQIPTAQMSQAGILDDFLRKRRSSRRSIASLISSKHNSRITNMTVVTGGVGSSNTVAGGEMAMSHEDSFGSLSFMSLPHQLHHVSSYTAGSRHDSFDALFEAHRNQGWRKNQRTANQQQWSFPVQGMNPEIQQQQQETIRAAFDKLMVEYQDLLQKQEQMDAMAAVQKDSRHDKMDEVGKIERETIPLLEVENENLRHRSKELTEKIAREERLLQSPNHLYGTFRSSVENAYKRRDRWVSKIQSDEEEWTRLVQEWQELLDALGNVNHKDDDDDDAKIRSEIRRLEAEERVEDLQRRIHHTKEEMSRVQRKRKSWSHHRRAPENEVSGTKKHTEPKHSRKYE